MHHYDVATKVLMDNCRDEIIRYFIGIDIRESILIEPLPQETVSLKRGDYPVLITDDKGMKRLVILEIQTSWDRTVPLDLLDYRTRYLIRHDDIEVISCILLLRPSGNATDSYRDNEVSFQYRLIKIFEMDAQTVVSEGPLCLMPFVPLMKHGKELIMEADTLIYQSELPKSQKCEMLTSMAILSGLISKDLPAQLVLRRKDIMIESYAYEIFKQDGILEGRQQGLREGRLEGRLEALTEALSAMLEMKFGIEGIKLINKIRDIRDVEMLKNIIQAIKLAASPQEVLNFIES